MRRIALLSSVICCLLSYVSSACNYTGAEDQTGKEFPDLIAQSADGYQLSAEFANNKTRETVLVNEYYNSIDKVGKLEIYRNGDFKQFYYSHDTDESYTISGFKCEAGNIISPPPFLEDGADRWLDFEDDRTILGPSAMLRRGFLAWESDKTKVQKVKSVEDDRSILLQTWRQCIGNDTIEYFFSEPTWHNAYNFSDMKVPVRVRYLKGNEEQVVEFFNYQNYLSKAEETFKIPEGYGCNRTADNEKDVPTLGATNHLLRGEMVYHSIDLAARKYSNFISSFQIAYFSKAEMIAYRYAPWKKGSTNKDGTTQTKPFTNTIFDNRNSILYVLNLETRECEIERDTEYFPSFELPGENEGSIDLLDPNILIDTEGFKYLGDRKERDIPVDIFEKEVRPMFLGNDRELAPVGVITRTYSSGDVIVNTGNQEVDVPIRVTISWYDDEEKTKLSGILVVNIFSYSTDVPFIHDYFNVRMCFRDYDASMWFKITFPNVGVTRSALLAHTKEIESEFMGVLFTHTETTPIRVPRLLIDVTDEDFSVDAMILERPPYYIEFDLRATKEITNWNESFGMLSEEDCLKKCVEYSQETGENCQSLSYCGATCFISTLKDPETIDNKECKLFDRAVTAKSLPSMDDLARSIRKLVVTDEFSLTFLINAGDQVKPVTFLANSFGDSYGDTRERLVSRLFQEEKFKVSFPGMKMKRGEKLLPKPFAKYSLAECMTTCLNDPYCETLSFCRNKECLVSESFITDLNIEDMDEDRNCIILARNYLQQYKVFPGVILTKSAKDVLTASDPGGCAKECSKQTKFECRSFDFCENNRKCLLHTTHYFQLKDKGEGMDVKANCTHYSKQYVYDFKMIPNRRSVGEAELRLQHNTVEDCATECKENGGFACTAFDFCDDIDTIDNKCFLIRTPPNDIKTVEMKNCRHYLNQGVIIQEAKKEKRYSPGLAGGLGFLFFLIGAAIGVGATYFFAFRYANRG